MLNALPAFRHANGSLSQQGLRLLGRMSEIWWWCHGNCFWFLSGLQLRLWDANDSAWDHYICWSWGVKKKKWWTLKKFLLQLAPIFYTALKQLRSQCSSSSRSVCDMISPKIPWMFIRFFFPPQLPQLALGQFWGICHETSAGCLWWPRRCAHWNGFHHQPKCHAALSGLDALSVDVVIFILGRGGPTKNRNVHKFLPNMLGPAASRSCWNILQGDIWREILDFLFSFWGLDACVTCNIMGIKGCPSNASTKNLLFFYGLSDLWASHKQAALPRLRSGVLPSQCFCGSFEAIVFNLQMKGFLDVF